MPIRLKTSIPGPRSRQLMELRRQHVARGPFHTTPIFVEKAHGAWLTDVDGNTLLDFAAGIGVVNVGHTAEKVVAAIQEQAKNLIHGSFNVTPYEGYVRLAEKLNHAAPGKFAKKTFLANSGAEAVENAVKIARAFTGRTGVVCFDQAFHGRTYMAMSLTYKDKPYKAGFGPLNTDVYRAPFPYCYRWPTGSDTEHVSRECFAQLKKTVEGLPAKPACVIIEPVTGEGGFIVAPQTFMQLLQEYCANQGIVFIADEIQTGFGRTGTIYTCEQMGITPDLILSAKGLGGGMPISAVTGRAEIMDGPSDGGIGGTFGGNPVSCAAALAVFDMFEHDRITEKAQKLGALVQNKMSWLFERHAAIGEVRGLGPMRAMELVKDRQSKEANPELAKKMIPYCFEHGLVIMSAGSYGNVVRLLMPVTIENADVETGFAILDAGLKELN